jgi:hypothetical protein
VKLQAVIRGHLVRRQAAESLQCLLGIVKMQGLVKAHQAQRSAGKFQVSKTVHMLHGPVRISTNSLHVDCKKIIMRPVLVKGMIFTWSS